MKRFSKVALGAIALAVGIGGTTFVLSSSPFQTKAATGTVTYTISDTKAVTGSDEPAGTSAAFTTTYTSNKFQLTSGKSNTLTLSGYSGMTITSLVLSMRSNGSAGAGKFSYSTDGGQAYSYLAGSASAGAAFTTWGDNTTFGTSYRDVTFSLATPIVASTSDLIFKMEGTTNSIYIQSYKLAWSKIVHNETVVTNLTATSKTFAAGHVVTKEDLGVTATINGAASQSYSNYTAEVGTLNAGTFTSRKSLDFSTAYVTTADNDIRITSLDYNTVDGMASDTFDIALTVTEIAPTAITLSATEASTKMGGTFQITVKSVTPYYASEAVTWGSSDETIATVNSTGLVTGVKGGTATITATSAKDSAIKSACTFSVKEIGPEATFTAATLGLTSASYANNDKVHEDSAAIYSVQTSNVMLGSSAMQVRKTPGCIWNTTSWTEDIGKIEISQVTGKEVADNELTLFYGSTVNPSTAGDSIVSSLTTSDATIVYDVSAKGSYKYFKIQGSSANTAYISSIHVISVLEEVRQFIAGFNTALNATCSDTAPTAITATTWATQSTAFSSLSSAAKAAVKEINVSSETDNSKKLAMSRYDYVMAKAAYSSFADFIGRFPSRGASPAATAFNTNDTNTIVPLIVLLAGTSVAGLFFLAKRKKHE